MESRLDDAVIQLQFLMNVCQIFQLNLTVLTIQHLQPYGAEIQPVRVYPEVLRSGHIPGLVILRSLVFYGIDLGVSMAQVEFFLRLVGLQVVGVFELMPAPVGHGCQRHTCLVFKREGLEACYIDGRCKMSVANSKGRERIGLGNDGVVARHHRLPVNILRGVLSVEPQHLHLQRCPYKRTDALGIIVADSL